MQGIDISSNNHNGAVFNFADVKAAGYSAVYVKATQGDNYLNPYLIADVRDAINNGLQVGVYHFYDSTHGTPQQQAEWFKRNGILAPVGDGSSTLDELCTLAPVFDYEQGPPMHSVPADFITALGMRCGVYQDCSFTAALDGFSGAAAFGWLAWPGWTNEVLPVGTAMVQTGQKLVPGIGEGDTAQKPTDVNVIVNAAVLLANAPTPTPTPTTKEEDMIESVVVTINGVEKLVTTLIVPGNQHVIQMTQNVATLGDAANGTNTSIIDITDAFPPEVPA